MRARDCTRDICRNRFSENARTPNCLHNICLYLCLRMYFRLCLHVDTSLFRLFKVARCGFVTIRCFSAVHKPHCLVVLEYRFALARILHVIVKALFFARSAHKCLLSSVSFFRFSCLNDIVLRLLFFLLLFFIQ